jgi:hypothetical protein
LAKHAAPTTELSEEDRFVSEAAEVSSRWKDERRRVERAHDTDMKQIRNKLEMAKALVDKSGVGTSTCTILELMGNWPSWSKQPNWVPPIDIKFLSGGELAKGNNDRINGRWIEWHWEQNAFRLELSRNRNYFGDDTDTGDIRLNFNGEIVLHLDCSKKCENERDNWEVFGISAFKAGAWMEQINDLAGRLIIADRQHLREFERKFYGEKAENIELPFTEC